MTKQTDAFVQKVDDLIELFNVKFKNVESHQKLLHSELSTLAKYNLNQDERREKDREMITNIGRAISKGAGVRQAFMWGAAFLVAICTAFVTMSVNTIKTEAYQYIDTKFIEQEEEMLESAELKKRVISIVSDKFFE